MSESETIAREAQLATDLQGCLGDFILANKDAADAPLSVISGLASTFGWFLALTLPKEKWGAATNMLSDLTVLAATNHARIHTLGKTRQ